MIHPHTELKTVNSKKGRGIFATSFIPKGSITYVKDPLEIEILANDNRLKDPAIKEQIETYSYIDENGIRIISWDIAKYVNHCCHCNTMSTGYGFEIAINDIESGEEITDEYGMFNFRHELFLSCEKEQCRGKVNGYDLEKHYEEWDEKVKDAIQELRIFLETGEGYRSVLELKSTAV